jgi:hypothetical protein
VAREVQALYCNGPAGGGGVRRNITERVKTGSVLVSRRDVMPRVSMVTEEDV